MGDVHGGGCALGVGVGCVWPGGGYASYWNASLLDTFFTGISRAK